MNESERRKVVKKLKEKKKEFEERERVIKELEKLQQTDTIKRYLELKNKILSLDNSLLNPNNFDEIILKEFKLSAHNSKNFFGCEHPIWIYLGSYKSESDGYAYESRCYSKRVSNESSSDFEYNLYRCVDCSKEEYVYGTNYKEFEEKNKVLKLNRISVFDFAKLQSEYYKYLYNHTLETSEKKLTMSFKERYGNL